MTQEFKNEKVSVAVENKPGCLIQFNITVTPETSKEAYKKALKAVNKEVSLPGFRKGKAPDPMIQKHYGSYVTEEWRQNLIQNAFSEAVKLTNIYPLNDRSVKKPNLKNASQEENSTVIIEFEAQPDLPAVELKNLEIHKTEPKPVSTDAIANFMDELRWHFAQWEEIKDRPVAEGDTVVLDIENLDKPGHFICQGTTFNVVKGKMGNWMHDKIIGLNNGESFEATSEQSPNEDIPGFVPTKCKITIKEIKKANLPELDDKLAASMGAKDVSDLEIKAKENLERQAVEAAREELRSLIEKKLLEKYPFDLPGSLVQAEIANRKAMRRYELNKAGLSQDAIREELEKEQDSMQQDVDQVLRSFFLIRKIGEENKIDVSQNELLEGLMQELYSSQTPVDFSKDGGETRSRVYVRLLKQKVLDFLVEHATMV